MSLCLEQASKSPLHYRHGCKKQKDKSRANSELPRAYGGGSHINMALSVHSEMMAIRFALSLSSHPSGASARSSVWYEIQAR